MVTTAEHGRPPTAAMSLTLATTAFQPMSSRPTRSRSEWTPATTASAASSMSPFGAGTTATSSPTQNLTGRSDQALAQALDEGEFG